MITIKHIQVIPMNIPLVKVLKWGRADELRQLRHVLIRVELSDGSVGIAEATPRQSIYGETQASILDIVENILAPSLLGAEVDTFGSVAALSARLGHIKHNNTAKGALDMAVHHALCRAKGESLADYLGCWRDRIILSTIVSTGTREQVLTDVATAYRSGLRVFKVKIGKDIKQETETLKELIRQFPQAQFYVDANQTLQDKSATQLLNALLSLGVIHCEEPLPIYKIKARQQLRRRCRMPIIADDSAFTFEELQRELEFDTFDILNIKTARTGFSQSQRMLELCQERGKSVMIGSQASSLLGCLHAAVFAAHEAVDCASECSFYLKTEADQTLAPPIVDGWVQTKDILAALEKLGDQNN